MLPDQLGLTPMNGDNADDGAPLFVAYQADLRDAELLSEGEFRLRTAAEMKLQRAETNRKKEKVGPKPL